MGKKNGNRFDSMKKIIRKGDIVFKDGEVGVYCNNCGEISDGNYSACPECKSKDISIYRRD